MPREDLPRLEVPRWIEDAAKSEDDPFPAIEALNGSVFYPASGVDGRPVQFMGGNFHSFVYVDYGYTRDELKTAVQENGFLGYELLRFRDLTANDLTPFAVDPSVVRPEDGDPRRMIRAKDPFCAWMIFKRQDGFNDDHGPLYFSLVYLCADGPAAYQVLYVKQKLTAAVICIIQPGTGFGGNWTDFTDRNSVLAREVLGNPAGQPDYLLYGGIGGRHFYEEACWPDYTVDHGWLDNNAIKLWSRPQRQ